MEFSRRARQLYAEREAVLDGDLRLTYGQFLERCPRWSSALQAIGPEYACSFGGGTTRSRKSERSWYRSTIGSSGTNSRATSNTVVRRWFAPMRTISKRSMAFATGYRAFDISWHWKVRATVG